MSFINLHRREITCKIVYYGAGLCGKTANLKFISQKANPASKGKMIELNTDEDRTLFFDFLPFGIGKVGGFDVRFHLYTVPGQVYYDHTRKLILKSVDGVVFVADSQVDRMYANIQTMENLRDNLAEHGYNLDKIPHVIQYNKRDMPRVVPVEELRKVLNPAGVPDFEAIAFPNGEGVFETLKTVSKLVLTDLKQRNAGGMGGGG